MDRYSDARFANYVVDPKAQMSARFLTPMHHGREQKLMADLVNDKSKTFFAKRCQA
jgi:hypothetical protein